jgi:hypothetical protein
MNAERTVIRVIGATGHMRRVVVCRLASLGHAVVAMAVQAAIRLPSALPCTLPGATTP